MGTVGTTQRRRPEVSDRTIGFGKSPLSQFPQAAVTKPQSIPKYVRDRLPNGSIRPESLSGEARRNARFSGGHFFAAIGPWSERAAILLIGQAVTRCLLPGVEAYVKAHVSFLWTASLVGAPAVHDGTLSGHRDRGLARTAQSRKPWPHKPWSLKPRF